VTTLVTRESLAAELRAAGVDAGATVLVHASLSSLGWVCGGAAAVVHALMDAVTPAGTLAMPAHSSNLSEPSRWTNPPVPADWWPTIRATMPAFDPRTTPTSHVGAVAEVFRSFPGVVRSAHPAGSFSAWGRRAAAVVDGHALGPAFGETSPLARLGELDALVLLLGVGHEADTSLHLAEVRWGGLAEFEEGAPVLVDGERRWTTFREFDYDTDDFAALGGAFAATGAARAARVGAATAVVCRQRALVDFAVGWMRTHRATKRG
jgi:aminoglycoside 3-N-acetyltransferase